MKRWHMGLIALALCLPLNAQELRKPATTVRAEGTAGHSGDPLPRARPEDAGMSSERLAVIGNVLNADITAGRLPGAVVAIARKGKLVYFDAFGYRDKPAGVRMTTDTIFSIASMTKPLTAVAALTLYERGALLMDDPLTKYFPQFADMRVAVMDPQGNAILNTVPANRKITIQDLMRHTSGIIYGNRGTTALHKLYSSVGTTMPGPEFVNRLAGLPLLWQPGTVWDYGYGLDLTGLVVESIAHKRLGEYLEERVFKPLGMVDTGFALSSSQRARYAKALAKDPDTGQPQSVGQDLTKPLAFDCGGGCAHSTAGDYMRFALMLLNKGKYGDTRILGRKTVEYMLSNQLGPDVKSLIANADPTRADYGFGLGLAVRTTPGVARMMGSVGEFSWPGASGTNWWADPREDMVVVFMAHSPGAIRWHYRQVISALVDQAIVD
jgi:CubicO group peptidase (beta-lactamase class C family)